jgi:hypothetical protein
LNKVQNNKINTFIINSLQSEKFVPSDSGGSTERGDINNRQVLLSDPLSPVLSLRERELKRQQ